MSRWSVPYAIFLNGGFALAFALYANQQTISDKSFPIPGSELYVSVIGAIIMVMANQLLVAVYTGCSLDGGRPRPRWLKAIVFSSWVVSMVTMGCLIVGCVMYSRPMKYTILFAGSSGMIVAATILTEVVYLAYSRGSHDDLGKVPA